MTPITRPTPTGAEDAPPRRPGESIHAFAARLAAWRRSRAQRTAFLGLTKPEEKEGAEDARS